MLKKEQSVKKTFTLMLAGILLVALLAPVIQAETKVTFDGQVRVREILDKTSVDTGAVFDHYVEMRSRFGVKAVVDDNATAYIQLQDSRIFGGANLQAINDSTIAGVRQSGTLNDSRNVDVHQAYISINNLFGEGFGAKMGRFEFNHGNQRVFGAVGWDNVSRAWDGGMYWYDHEKFNVSAIWLKPMEMRDATYNRDFDIFGLTGKCNTTNLEWFAVYETNADTNTSAIDSINTVEKLSRIDLGLYYKRKMGQFDVEMNTVYQTGSMAKSSSDTLFPVIDSLGYDISAFLITFEAGYSLEGEKNIRFAAGIDYATGNDPTETDTTKWTAYNNMYYTGHKFNGYMDYFLAGKVKGKPYANAGLMDIMLRGKFDPIPGWTVKTDVHLFSTAQDYADPTSTTGAMTKDIGTEIDISVSTTRVAGVKLDCGFSYFMAKDAFAGMTDSDPGIWAYSMATITF